MLQRRFFYSEKSPSEWINFECVHNIDEHGVETVTTMREALKTWNMTVQWWLAANIYKRLPSSVPRALRAVAVMVTSSAWHGVYAGSVFLTTLCPLISELKTATKFTLTENV